MKLSERVVSADEAGIHMDEMVAPHGHPDHVCSRDFVYEMRFTGDQMNVMHRALAEHGQLVIAAGFEGVIAGEVKISDVTDYVNLIVQTSNQIVEAAMPRIEEQVRREKVWEEFHTEVSGARPN